MILVYTAPEAGSLQTCYSPLLVAATADGVPKVAYCDVYVNDIFYVTLTATYPIRIVAGNATFQFDLSGALQPLFKVTPPGAGETSLIPAPDASKRVFCRLRGSTVDAGGLIVPDGPVPVQGVDGVEPIPGGGLETPAFFALPFALQDTDGEDLTAHLTGRRNGSWRPAYYPLTNRPAVLKIGLSEVDFYPFLKTSDTDTLTSIQINYLLKGWTEWSQESNETFPYMDPGAYLLPTGPQQVENITGIDMDTVDRYFLRVLDENFNELCTTPTFYPGHTCEDDTRLLFQNYAGTLDGVTLTIRQNIREVDSKKYVIRTGGRTGRHNINSAENITAYTAEYDERDQPWLMELLESPAVWQVTDQGYRHMTITDGKLPTQKDGERYNYEFTVNLQPSKQRKTQRG